MISDNYSSVSEGLADTLKKLFVDKKDPKELGIPKLGVQIIQSLNALLNVKFVSSVDDTGKPEVGFLFPIVFDPNKEQSTEIVDEKNEDIEDISQPDSEIETGEPEIKPKEESIAPEILSSPENKFDAIDFVSGVDNSIPPTDSDDNDLSDEPTSVTEDIHEALISEDETDHDEVTLEPEFKPLSFQPGEDKSTDDSSIQEDISFDSEEGTEIPDITEVPIHQDVIPDENTEDESGTIETSPPESTDEQFEEINLINRQAFTFEEAADGRMNSSDDKLGLHGLTCLYIEDQVDSQILFKVQMKGLKEIKYAVSFEDAIPLLETESFDFIVMDINLQGEYNGLDALKIIHKMPKYEDVPIIAVTAYVLPGDKEKFISTGFNDFISKPIFREKMVESLEKIFLQKA
jgi:CheY-like chemotaxis protein